MPVFNSSLRLRVSVVSAAVGIALIGALAMFFRRRRKKVSLYHDIYIESSRANSDVVDYGKVSSNGSERLRHKSFKLNASNGDITIVSHGSSPNTTIRRSTSTGSVKSDADSASTVIYSSVTRNTNLSPPQLLEVGVEFISRARSRWELALQQIDETRSSEQDGYSAELREHLSQLLELVNRVCVHAECRSAGRGFFNQVCTSAALDAALDEMDREYEQQRRRTYSFDEASSSDMESFVSALDTADFTDLEEQKEAFQHLALYEAALIELSHGSVPCRVLRTKNVKCASDTEFFAKLHCIRLAFTELFAEPENSEFFVSVGRDLISSLLLHAQRDADEFLCAYDSLIAYVRNRENSSEMEEELRSRGVKMMTFYDVVIDFLLFDAFDDLENPPASLIAVLQNRWLTTGFKETALATAVWSVLKAKRRMLKFPKGFIAHFYAVSESVSPTLAWGFLGPDGALKDMCNFFKNQVLEFMWDIFSFNQVRYTSVELLALDIMQLARERATIASAHMSAINV